MGTWELTGCVLLQTEFGIVYSLVEDKMYCAQRGKGAFLNGVPLKTSGQEGRLLPSLPPSLPPSIPLYPSAYLLSSLPLYIYLMNVGANGCKGMTWVGVSVS